MRYTSLAIFILTAISSCIHAESPRQRISLNAGWRFTKEDPAGLGDSLESPQIRAALIKSSAGFLTASGETPGPLQDAPISGGPYAAQVYDDSTWRLLDLPHDWGIEGPFQQSLPGETGKLPWAGIGWYRNSFEASPTDLKGNTFLQIDGAMSHSIVWLNGKLVGGWPFGYASYQLDLTPYLTTGKNTLAIRLNNPAGSSRWYPGGGIYRNVWLLKTQPIHFAHWSTQITTPEVSASSAKIHITTHLVNPKEENVTLSATIYQAGPDGQKTGKPIATVRFSERQSTDSSGTQSATLELKSPRLWSNENPQLYIAVTEARLGSVIVDQEEITMGIRSIEFNADKGFLLNGKRVPIQGVCMHHDLGALGSAINRRALERQLEILKEMGTNAIRTSHNPPAPELLELCDRMGLLVMDEFVDCWKSGKTTDDYHTLFSEWSEKDLRALVRRDRNHPSVILWSIGNEIKEQSTKDGPEIAKQLSRYVAMEDKTRLTCVGANLIQAGYNGFQKGVDVFGYNYKPQEYAKFHKANPSQPLIGSETSSTISSRGTYVFPFTAAPDQGRSDFQVSSYDLYTPKWATTPDTEFKGQEQNSFVAGEFVWTGFDYLGEPTPYNKDETNLLNYSNPEERARAEKELAALGKIQVPSRSSYFGIIDLAGFKKDRFYLYQSHWLPNHPMAHILPHWNWQGREGEVTPVHVYTSGTEAELFLNGRSLGKKTKGPFEYRLRWDEVKYEPGTLKVVATKNSKPWATNTVKTTGPAAKLIVKADRSKLLADGKDLSFITVTIADKDGLLVPRAMNLVKFEVTGPAEIIATDNGDATSHVSFQAKERQAFNGLCLGIVRTTKGNAGSIKLRVTSGDLKPVEIPLTSAKAP